MTIDAANCDIGNVQAVALQGNKIFILMPAQIMTPEQAYIHAAWLVAVADVASTLDSGSAKENDFETILERVRNS